MDIVHSWDVWKELTTGLERKGKFDEVEAAVYRASSRTALYNEIIRTATTVEEILILAYHAGYLRGRFDAFVETTRPTVGGG